MSWILNNWDEVGGLAAVLTAIIAIVGLGLAGRTIHAQREAAAKDIYREYLKLAFQNPDLSESSDPYHSLKANSSDKGKRRYKQYRWFVAFMLNACDEIIRLESRDAGWHLTIREDLLAHVEYLRSRDFAEDGGWGMYSRRLKKIFDLL